MKRWRTVVAMGWLSNSNAVEPSERAASLAYGGFGGTDLLGPPPPGGSVRRPPLTGEPVIDWTYVLQLAVDVALRDSFPSRPRNIVNIQSQPQSLEVSVGFLHPEYERESFGVAFCETSGPRHRRGNYFLDFLFGDGLRSATQVIPFGSLLYSRSGAGSMRFVSRVLSIWRSELSDGPYLVRRPSQSFEPHCDAIGFGGGSPGAAVRTHDRSAVGEVGCAHVLGGRSVGDSVALGRNGSGEIISIDKSVDLAVVERQCDHELVARPLQRWPAQWMPCSFTGNATSTSTARIAQVTNTFGVFTDPTMPVWFDLDEAGAPGDSGAAVIDNTSGHLCGIYRGKLTDPRGFEYGRCAHIQQAEQVMGLEFVQ